MSKPVTEDLLQELNFSYDGRSYFIDLVLFNQLVITRVGTPFIANIKSTCPKTSKEKMICLGFHS